LFKKAKSYYRTKYLPSGLRSFCKAIYENNKEYADKLELEIGEINGWRKKNLSKRQN